MASLYLIHRLYMSDFLWSSLVVNFLHSVVALVIFKSLRTYMAFYNIFPLGYPCYATYLLPISPMLLGHALQWSFSLSCGIITVYMLISFSISQSGCCYCIQNNLKALATNGSNLIANGSVSTCCMHVDSHSFLGPTINVLKTWTETFHSDGPVLLSINIPANFIN